MSNPSRLKLTKVERIVFATSVGSTLCSVTIVSNNEFFGCIDNLFENSSLKLKSFLYRAIRSSGNSNFILRYIC